MIRAGFPGNVRISQECFGSILVDPPNYRCLADDAHGTTACDVINFDSSIPCVFILSTNKVGIQADGEFLSVLIYLHDTGAKTVP